MANTLIGQTLGHYRIVDQLGAGGMGVVYRAQDLKLGRQVALKVLPAGSASDAEAIERFKREARTASSLNHTNICTIYGFDEHEGQLYLAMELLDGDPLDRRLSGKPLDMRIVFDIATQVADALDAAHVGGVLHRDVKPANIFLTRRGTVKVLDFGLAKLSPDFRRSGRLADGRNDTSVPEHFSSVAGTTVGTIAYMSPEQARGEDVDPRTDLFSFGVVMYEMATGRQSFPGHTTAVVFDGILNRDPAPASSFNPLVPAELDRIISKALEKDRAMRYQTAADLGADLKRLRRDSTSRPSIPAALASVPQDAATVVLPSGNAPIAGPGFNTSAYAASANAPTAEFAGNTPLPPAPASGIGGAPLRPRSTVTAPGTKTTWLVGAGVAVLVIAAIAGGIGAYVASRNSAPAPPVDQTAANQAGAAAAPPTASAPAPVTSAPAPPPAVTQPAVTPPVTTPPAAAPTPAKATPPGSAAAGASGATGGTRPSDRKATGAAPLKPLASSPVNVPATPLVSRETEAAQRLEVARAKVANHLNDQALIDLRQIGLEYPGTRASIEAAFLAGELHEKSGKNDDAMAAYVEVESRFKGDARAADAKLRRAGLLGRSRQPRAELQSRQLLNEVVIEFPGTPQASVALQTKLKIETERRDLREIDPVLKIEVPAAMVTLRTIIEQFPNSPQTLGAMNRLAAMLGNMNRHAEAAQVMEEIVAKYPGNPMNVWFRLGETYERRLNDPVKAKAAYARVPMDSPTYNEAQKRLNRK